MIKRLFIAFAMLTTVAAGASAQFASDGYIDRYDDDTWLHRGYRGSVWVGAGPELNQALGASVEIYTSHGYQFNNWFYLGGGIGFNYLHEWDDDNSFTAFVNPQFSLPLDSRFSPFLDLQIGFKSDGDTGFHFSPSLGCRFAITENWGINLSVAYLRHTNKYIWTGWHYDSYYSSANSLMFRLGVDFNL